MCQIELNVIDRIILFCHRKPNTHTDSNKMYSLIFRWLFLYSASFYYLNKNDTRENSQRDNRTKHGIFSRFRMCWSFFWPLRHERVKIFDEIWCCVAETCVNNAWAYESNCASSCFSQCCMSIVHVLWYHCSLCSACPPQINERARLYTIGRSVCACAYVYKLTLDATQNRNSNRLQ